MIPSILGEGEEEEEGEKEGRRGGKINNGKEEKSKEGGKGGAFVIRIYRWRGTTDRNVTRGRTCKRVIRWWRRSIVARLIMRPNLTSISDCNNLLVL